MKIIKKKPTKIRNTKKRRAFNSILQFNLLFIVVLASALTTVFLLTSKDHKSVLNMSTPTQAELLQKAVTQTKLTLPEFRISFNKDAAAKIRNYKLLPSDQQTFVATTIWKAGTHLTKNPNPIQYIQMEGRAGNDPGRLATVNSLKDIHYIYDLGFAYTATNDKKYLDKSEQYLLAWANTNIPTGNPINEDHLYPLFRGYDMVRTYVKPESKVKIDAWLTKIADMSIKYQLPTDLTISNWNTHRLNTITHVAFILNNEGYKTYARDNYKKHINNNLNADGTSYDFIQRDALHYHLYNLEPYLHSSHVFKLNNEDMYNYTASNGASIRKSVTFVIPYVEGKKTHVEFANSKAIYDRGKGGSNFAPQAARYVLEVNYLITGEYFALTKSLTTSTAPYSSFEYFLRAL